MLNRFYYCIYFDISKSLEEDGALKPGMDSCAFSSKPLLAAGKKGNQHMRYELLACYTA